MGAERNAQAMGESLDRVRTGAVAPAARDDARGRFRQGDAIGLIEDEIVVWGTPAQALGSVLEILGGEAELITSLRGVGAPLDDETVRSLAPADVELELFEGGQQSYWWLLAAE